MIKQVIFIFLVFSNLILANEVETLFKKGNDDYLKGDFEEAILTYQKIINQDYMSKSLYYNLGNAYFRIGKIGMAILYYEKAKKISPSDEDINYNIAFANSRIVDKIETLPKFFIFEWWENLLTLFSISGWSYAAYIFFLLILFSFGFYFFAKSIKAQRLSFYSGIISALFFIVTIILLAVNLNREMNIRYGIIVDHEVISKFSPDANSGDAFVVHEGLKVITEDSVSDWIKIKLIDGKVGWVKKESLKII